ncbi:MAG: pyridoxine 5'-phosphate synthase [Gammaproteobacteria bacterium]|nr:pyridoxine 5'-phosphate synthase [Gammaproteobacteria bacterium]
MTVEREILLGVNIDHVATLRQQRGTRYPEPVQAALIAEQAGADAITIHLREDRRHIQERDVILLNDTLQTRMNLEMAATREMLDIATKIEPHDCCIVPEKREELTTEGGLNVASNIDYLREYCQTLKESKIRVSLFIDADPRQLDAAASIGAPVVEIHTGQYADATNDQERVQEFENILNAVAYGKSIGLQVNAGHGLDYHNVKRIVGIKGITELNIGHSIISHAIFTGLEAAVSEMKFLLTQHHTMP